MYRGRGHGLPARAGGGRRQGRSPAPVQLHGGCEQRVPAQRRREPDSPGGGTVILTVSDSTASAVYVQRSARVTRHRIVADFGDLGRLSYRFHGKRETSSGADPGVVTSTSTSGPDSSRAISSSTARAGTPAPGPEAPAATRSASGTGDARGRSALSSAGRRSVIAPRSSVPAEPRAASASSRSRRSGATRAASWSPRPSTPGSSTSTGSSRWRDRPRASTSPPAGARRRSGRPIRSPAGATSTRGASAGISAPPCPGSERSGSRGHAASSRP